MPRSAALLLLALAVPVNPAAAAPPRVPSESLASVAAAVGVGRGLRVSGVEVPSTSEMLSFDLERFEVFARDATILVHGDEGTRRRRVPNVAYFRGGIAGEPSSRVFLAALPGGRVQGVASREGDDYFLIAHRHAGEVRDISVAALYCAAARRDVLDEVGPLDEDFGIGLFEDDDYSLRVREAGYRVICVEDAYVHHVGQSSFQRLSARDYQELWQRNQALFERKWGRSWTPHVPRVGVKAPASRVAHRPASKAGSQAGSRERVP